MPHVWQDFANCLDHRSVGVCDYTLRHLLSHAPQKSLQQPHVCLFGLVRNYGTTKNSGLPVIVKTKKRYEWHTIAVHLVRAVKYKHVAKVLIVMMRLGVTPEHPIQVSFLI